MKEASLILVVLAAVAIGWQLGRADGHIEVAKDCDKLASFYVGKDVYLCQRKDLAKATGAAQ